MWSELPTWRGVCCIILPPKLVLFGVSRIISSFLSFSSSLDSAFSLNHHDMMLVIFFLPSLLFFSSPLWFLVWFFILYNLYVSFFINFNPYILAYRNNRTFCKNDVWIYSAIESEATKNAVVNCLTKVFVKNDVWKRGCIKFVTIEK